MSVAVADDVMLCASDLLAKAPRLYQSLLQFLSRNGVNGGPPTIRREPDPANRRAYLYSLRDALAWAAKHRDPPDGYVSTAYVLEQHPWMTKRLLLLLCKPEGEDDFGKVKSWPLPKSRAKGQRFFIHYGDLLDEARWYVDALPDSFTDAPPSDSSHRSLGLLRAIVRSKVHSEKGKPATETATFKCRVSHGTIRQWIKNRCPPLGRDENDPTKFKRLPAYRFHTRGGGDFRDYVADDDVKRIQAFKGEQLETGELTKAAAETLIGGGGARHKLRRHINSGHALRRNAAVLHPTGKNLAGEGRLRVVSRTVQTKRGKHTRFIPMVAYKKAAVDTIKKPAEYDSKARERERRLVQRLPLEGLVDKGRCALRRAIKAGRVSKDEDGLCDVEEWKTERKRLKTERSDSETLPKPGDPARAMVDDDGKSWWPSADAGHRLGVRGDRVGEMGREHLKIEPSEWSKPIERKLWGSTVKSPRHWDGDVLDKLDARMKGLPDPPPRTPTASTTTVKPLAPASKPTRGRQPLPGNDPLMLPADYYLSKYGILADTLKKSAKRGKLPCSEKRGGRWFHHFDDVRRAHSDAITTAEPL